jgi:hypothetical protein
VLTSENPAASGRAVESKNAGQGTGIMVQTHSANAEIERRGSFHQLYRESPIPDSEQLQNVGLFTSRQVLSRTLFLHSMYQEIISVPGIVIEFGVRWGRDLVAFSNFRGIYEPFNYTRRIVGFDTFEGFPSVHRADTAGGIAALGGYATTQGYESYLGEVMSYHESESPLSHICKYELIKGDVSETVPTFFARHPETLVALAYFDLDLYEPTLAALKAVLPHLTKGGVLGFDELNYPEFPGETLALSEVLPLGAHRFRRVPYAPTPCYTVFE